MIIVMSVGTFFTILAVVAFIQGIKSPKFWIVIGLVAAFFIWLAYGNYEYNRKEELEAQNRVEYLKKIGALDEIILSREIEVLQKDKSGEVVSKNKKEVSDVKVRIYPDSIIVLVPEKLNLVCHVTFNNEVKINEKNEFTKMPRYKFKYLGENKGIHRFRLLPSDLPHSESLEMEYFGIKWSEERGNLEGLAIWDYEDSWAFIQKFYKID